jgi:hypothetical protein
MIICGYIPLAANRYFRNNTLTSAASGRTLPNLTVNSRYFYKSSAPALNIF